MDYRSLKIIHINATDCGGGAAIACSRHCEAMIKAGCDSHMLVVTKRGHQMFVPHSRWGWRSLLSTYYRVMSTILASEILSKRISHKLEPYFKKQYYDKLKNIFSNK